MGSHPIEIFKVELFYSIINLKKQTGTAIDALSVEGIRHLRLTSKGNIN